MTTPGTMNGIIESLRSRIADAARDCERLQDSPYSEGYDDGFLAALKEVFTEITGEAP